MGHNEGPRQITEQQILNAVYNSNVSALRMDLELDSVNLTVSSGDAGLFRVSGIQGDASIFRTSAFDGGFTYNNISTSAQTVVKSGAGILGVVAVNSTLTSAVRGYDNTVSGGNILFTIPATTGPTSIQYRARFATGLVVSTGAAADNVTIMFN